MTGAVVDLVAPDAGVSAVTGAAAGVEVQRSHARVVCSTIHRASVLFYLCFRFIFIFIFFNQKVRNSINAPRERVQYNSTVYLG